MAPQGDCIHAGPEKTLELESFRGRLARMGSVLHIKGFAIHGGYLDAGAQARVLEDVRRVVAQAPLFTPVTPRGQAMSVRMTSAGRYGWVSDRRGYRYDARHPSGVAWPGIPDSVLAIWRDLVSAQRDPDCCLVNYYGPEARMGMHQDRDEADFAWPVLSVSLGDEGLFRMGNVARGGKTQSIWLRSGDVVVMGGDARMAHHGVDRIKPGTSTLLSAPGRVNLTLRVVD